MSRKPGGGKPPAVAKPPHHAAGAAPSRAHLQREVNRLQRQVSRLQHSGKHPHSTAKHKPGKGSKKHAKRGLALGDTVACCAAEALAASLRLTGHPVSDEDVLKLYFYTADGPDAGTSIEETLWAAAEHGLAGEKPSWAPVAHPFLAGGLIDAYDRAVLGRVDVTSRAADNALAAGKDAFHAPLTGPVRAHLGLAPAHGLILGVDLPGPHTVTVAPDGQWLTWGAALPPFPGAVIEEAWEIRWPS